MSQLGFFHVDFLGYLAGMFLLAMAAMITRAGRIKIIARQINSRCFGLLAFRAYRATVSLSIDSVIIVSSPVGTPDYDI